MDISAAAGGDLSLDSVVTNSDGTVRDITGSSGEFPIYDSPNATVQVADGIATVTDGPAGKITYSLAADQTTGFTDTTHVLYFETWLTEAFGTRSRLDSGRLTLT